MQRGHHAVQLRHHLLVRLEVLPVAVPPRAAHAHEGHARLDHPPRHQRLLAEERRAIRLARLRRLLGQVEERLAAHQAVDARIGVRVALHWPGAVPGDELVVNQLLQLRARVVVQLRDGLQPLQVRRRHALGQFHRGVTCAEETGTLPREVAPLGGGVEGDVVRHLAVRAAQFAREHRAHVGVAQARLVRPAAHHELRGPAVVAVLRVQPADDADVLHALCHLRHQLADVDARHGGGDGRERPARGPARLRVPRLQLARAARQPEQDDALAAGLERVV